MTFTVYCAFYTNYLSIRCRTEISDTCSEVTRSGPRCMINGEQSELKNIRFNPCMLHTVMFVFPLCCSHTPCATVCWAWWGKFWCGSWARKVWNPTRKQPGTASLTGYRWVFSPLHRPYTMGGTFQATAGFQDSDFFQKTVKNSFEMDFECEFSPFRIQTLTWSNPCTLNTTNIFLYSQCAG